jgi:hypothetical protein
LFKRVNLGALSALMISPSAGCRAQSSESRSPSAGREGLHGIVSEAIGSEVCAWGVGIAGACRGMRWAGRLCV